MDLCFLNELRCRLFARCFNTALLYNLSANPFFAPDLSFTDV